MSSGTAAPARLRIILGNADISLIEASAHEHEPLCRVPLGDDALETRLAELAGIARAHGGEIEAVLPEFEIRRGHLEAHFRGGTARRTTAARARASLEMAMPYQEIAVTVGRRWPDGTTPWAAVRSEVLDQTEAFLAGLGLTAARISVPGSLPSFRREGRGLALPPALTGRTALLSGSAAAAALALAVVLIGGPETAPEARASRTETEIELTSAEAIPAPAGPQVFAEGPAVADPPARVAPPPPRPQRLALARAEPPMAAPATLRIAAATPPEARIAAPAPAHEPTITKAARNFPAALLSLPAPSTAAPPPLADLRSNEPALPDAAIPSLVLAQILDTLPRTGVEVMGTTRLASLRPLHRPVLSDASPEPLPLTAADSGRPRPRPGGNTAASADLSAAIAGAVAAAAVEGAGTTTAERPLPRSAPPAAAKTVFQPQPPAVIRPAPAAAAAVTTAALVAAPTPEVKQVVRVKPPAPEPPAATHTTEQVGIDPRELSLIGVFGSPLYKRAILRLPNGQMRKVRAGDRIEGSRVVAVSDDSVRLTGRGRELVLRLSD